MKALVIGRFQPLHNGHILMLDYVACQEDELVIGVGSSNARVSSENPFTYGERVGMLEKSIRFDTPYTIVPVPDFGDNDKWVGNILESIDFDEVYTNAENEKRIFEGAGVKVNEIPFYDRQEYCASTIRKLMVSGGEWQSLVPQGAVDVLNEIAGEERIRGLSV